MTETRQETYEQLIAMGNTPAEAWSLMEQMDFAEDYDETHDFDETDGYDCEWWQLYAKQQHPSHSGKEIIRFIRIRKKKEEESLWKRTNSARHWKHTLTP